MPVISTSSVGATAAVADAAASGTTSTRVLLVRAGTRICALPIGAVVETMRLLPVRPVPGVPEAVRGISILRGKPVPVVDLAALLGDAEDPQAGRLVAIRTGNRQVGLAVRDVLRIVEIPGTGTLPPLLQDACAARVRAIAALDAELFWVLDAARLVSAETWDLLAEAEK
jgi:purine-binding chemotaxis protein CheW